MYVNGDTTLSNFELGKGRVERLQEVFNVSILIHGIVALVILVVAETIGLWFFME